MPSRRLRALNQHGGQQSLLQYAPMCGAWALTSYDACDLRCSYCSSYAQGPSEPLVPAGEVRALLDRELPAVPATDPIAIGPIIDGYTHAEAEHGVTRAALEVLVEHGRRIVIITKGTLIRRDLDLLRDNGEVRVCVSIPSLDEQVLARIEPQAPSAADRLALLEDLMAAGIAAQLHVQPWIPGMTDAAGMVAWADGRCDTWFAPLNVQNPLVARSAWGRRLSQREVNEAYLAAMQDMGAHHRVTWARPAWLHDSIGVRNAPVGGADGRGRPHEQAVRGCRPAVEGSHQDRSPTADRDVATTVRVLEAMTQDRMALIGMEVLSAHVCFYIARYPERTTATQGPAVISSFLDVVAALTDSTCMIHMIEATDAVTRVEYTLVGTLERELHGYREGTAVAVDVVGAFRFDDHGLIIELWQQIEAVRHHTDDRDGLPTKSDPLRVPTRWEP